MKILITGAKGQLGREITEIIKIGRADIGEISESIKVSEVIAFDVDGLDITNLVKVKEVLNYLKPEVVINCAAATNVDKCEIDEDFAFMVNSIGPRNLAIACDSIGAKLVQVSTDYVFNKNTNKPLKEYDLTSPSSVYGKTKLLGEEYVKLLCSKHFIVRTAWLYGYVGSNFVYKIMKLSKEKTILML